MNTGFLSPPVLALAHNVELNKAGWNTRALERLLLGALWIDGGPTKLEALGELLRSSFGIESKETDLVPIVDRLVSAGTLERLPSQRIGLSSSGSRDIQNELQSVEADEKAAKEYWEGCLVDREVDLGTSWSDFQEKLLGPLVLEQGAGTYRVFTGEAPEWNRRLVEHLAGSSNQEAIRALKLAVDDFLAADDERVRSYLLRTLRAHLSWQAGQLPAEVIEQVIDGTALEPKFRLFLDTNFLFSMLDLHANPANEAAQALFSLLRDLPNRIDVKLFALPLTADEMKGVLVAQKLVCAGLRLPPGLAASALEADNLSGVIKRYVERCLEAGHSLSASEYFDPYLEDLTTILRAKGIELYNHSMSTWKTRQDVVDDILHIQEQLDRGPRPKSYAQIEHDAVLWHVVDDLRPDSLESPIEADSWVVTIDYRLLGFDGYKHRSCRDQPVCIHPTNLVQLLSFWIPRSETLDEAMIECLRLPFLFQEFDKDAESVTLRILGTLGRFENVDDLPKEAALSLLANRALRDRISSATSEESDVELIREALLEDNNKLREAFDGAKHSQTEADRRTAEKEAEVALLSKRVESLTASIGSLGEVKGERDQLKLQIGQLEKEKAGTEEAMHDLSARVEALSDSRSRSTFLWTRLVLIPLASAFLGVVGGHFLGLRMGAAPGLMPVLLGISVLSLTGAIACRFPAPSAEIASWSLYRTYRLGSGWVLGTCVVGLALELLGSALSNSLTG